MADNSSNRAIVDRMLQNVRSSPRRAAQAPTPSCGAGFVVEDFAITYPNGELIANVAVTAVPSGVVLLGVTVAATAGNGRDTYCMGVAYDDAGLSLPVSVLGASTSPVFSKATAVTGLVVLCYKQGGSTQQCTISRQFTVGG